MGNIKNLIINEEKKTTVLLTNDGEVTKVKCLPEDKYNRNLGIVLVFFKYLYGNHAEDLVKRFKKDVNVDKYYDTLLKISQFAISLDKDLNEKIYPVLPLHKGFKLPNVPIWALPYEVKYTDTSVVITTVTGDKIGLYGLKKGFNHEYYFMLTLIQFAMTHEEFKHLCKEYKLIKR